MKKCDYGCGQEAKYEMCSGKMCCSKNYQSCPSVRKKNSENVKKAHERGDVPTSQLDGNRKGKKGKTYNIGENGKKPISETKDKENIKRKLIEQRKRKCEKCGEKKHCGKKIPLDIHRIDDSKSYFECGKKDFELLCPNCHRQTENWGNKQCG